MTRSTSRTRNQGECQSNVKHRDRDRLLTPGHVYAAIICGTLIIICLIGTIGGH